LAKKKIIGLFPELLGIGGVQEAGRLTAAALDEIARSRGWTTEFVALNDPFGPHSLGVAGRAISFRGFGRMKVRFTLSGINRAFGLPGGVVLAGHPNLAPPASWMRRTNSGLKTIVMSHGIDVWQPLPGGRRRALAGADLVLGPSNDTTRKLVDVQHVAQEKVRKLAWPLNPAFLRMAEAPERLPLPAGFPQGRVILTVGRWAAAERYKGADELIRAMSQLRAEAPGVHLVAVGGGDDLPRLRKLVTDLGMTGSIHFFENLQREEIGACYSRAEIFALPSTGEGFGLVFLEAMAFSKPVLGVCCGGATDVIEDDVNGLMTAPGNSEELAQGLRRLLSDVPLRERLGQRGAQIVRQKYAFDVFRGELESVLGD